MLKIRIGEHLSNIRRGFTHHSVSWHFRQYHNRDPSLLEVLGIERYIPRWRGNDSKRHISRREMRWIFDMQCYSPLGLNIKWDINCYINNSCVFVAQCHSYTLLTLIVVGPSHLPLTCSTLLLLSLDKNIQVI